MKTYYELTKNERNKYFKEFKKTPVGKEFTFRFICIAILVGTFWFAAGFIQGYSDGINDGVAVQYVTTESEKVELFVNTMETLGLAGILILSAYSSYINVNFTAWLKNKYDIKRW